jgi:hypothetical protein
MIQTGTHFSGSCFLVEHDPVGKPGSTFPDHAFWWSMIFSENRDPLFRIMPFWWSMILSENRDPLFRIMLKL